MTATHACFAVATPGFEPVVARELQALGMSVGEPEAGGVAFRADDRQLVAANLNLRAASRVLVRVAGFTARSFAELERRAKAIPWTSYLSPGARVEFRVTCKKSRLYHSDAVAERLGKWLVTAAPGIELGRTGLDDDEDSPSAGGATPTARQLFIVRFLHDHCTISADSSGELLHRRGYRLAVAKAPLRETIAAGCLLALGYDGHQPMIDPMCGSGTIAIEAALIARRIPPGLNRTFACEGWPAFSASGAKLARREAKSRMLATAPAPILASDRDAGAIMAANANAERAGVTVSVSIVQGALSAIEPPPGRGLMIANPPYGVRVGEKALLRDLYAQFGNVVRTRLRGWRVALIAAERSLEAQAKLPFEDVVRFSNGGIKVRLVATRDPAP